MRAFDQSVTCLSEDWGIECNPCDGPSCPAFAFHSKPSPRKGYIWCWAGSKSCLSLTAAKQRLQLRVSNARGAYVAGLLRYG